MISNAFLQTKPGTPGRRALRRLDDAAIARALLKSKDQAHMAKFLPRKLRPAKEPKSDQLS